MHYEYGTANMEMQSMETTTIYCSDYTIKLWNMHIH
jgi:hypothetical protein